MPTRGVHVAGAVHLACVKARGSAPLSCPVASVPKHRTGVHAVCTAARRVSLWLHRGLLGRARLLHQQGVRAADPCRRLSVEVAQGSPRCFIATFGRGVEALRLAPRGPGVFLVFGRAGYTSKEVVGVMGGPIRCPWDSTRLSARGGGWELGSTPYMCIYNGWE